MKATVKKWGNSASLRIPASVMEATRLRLDDGVDVSEDKGRIIIQPVRHRSYRLEDLLRGINAKNLPELVDSGPPVGKEIW